MAEIHLLISQIFIGIFICGCISPLGANHTPADLMSLFGVRITSPKCPPQLIAFSRSLPPALMHQATASPHGWAQAWINAVEKRAKIPSHFLEALPQIGDVNLIGDEHLQHVVYVLGSYFHVIYGGNGHGFLEKIKKLQRSQYLKLIDSNQTYAQYTEMLKSFGIFNDDDLVIFDMSLKAIVNCQKSHPIGFGMLNKVLDANIALFGRAGTPLAVADDAPEDDVQTWVRANEVMRNGFQMVITQAP